MWKKVVWGFGMIGVLGLLTSSNAQVPTRSLQTSPTTYARLPACGSNSKGMVAYITDSNTVTWGATAAGGSSSNAGVQCNGTNWTVFSK